MKIAWWKLALILGVTAWALFEAWPRADRPLLNMRLGLDLKGGSHLVMQVQTDDAVKAEADVQATRIGDRLRREGFPESRATLGERAGEIVISGIPAARLADAQRLVSDEARNWMISTSGGSIVVQMPQSEIDYAKDNAVKQALTTISNRIDAFGVGETNKQRLGGEYKDRILVELPGVEDPSRVKGLIQTQARLELRLAYYAPNRDQLFLGATKEDVVAQLGGQVPAGVVILPVEETDKQTLKKVPMGFLAVEKASVITGSDLQDARPTRDQFGQTVVSFKLRVGAADRFSKFTRANVGRAMPIVLDEKVISYPRINSEIGMDGQISGGFTPQSAEDLSLQLKAGALPARIVTIEERTVGPSLGKDSIDAGVRASLIGSVAICLFMLVYYRRSGINAIVALLLNLLILAAFMSRFDAVLTLPGIAGYALTVGMAVDSNVLIFERIREELRHGRTVRAAIDLGFNKAFSAIFDTHVTTIVSAMFLFTYGTGPVKGFAVSLSVGLIANLFTALVVSRFIFDLEVGDRPVKHLSI